MIPTLPLPAGLPSGFPAEQVPDGSVGVPHHFYTGALIALFAAAVVWDDHRREEPLVVGAGTIFGIFAFVAVWPRYPSLGAALSVVFATAVATAALRPAWVRRYPLRWQVVALIGGLIMLDDALSHATGVWTPLDHYWRAAIRPALGIG